MELLFAWIVFAAAAASLAKGKNRRVPVWVGLGLLLGPFALLLIGLLKPAPGAQQDYQ